MAAAAFDHPALNAHAVAVHSPLSRLLLAVAVTVATWEVRAKTRRSLKDMDPLRYADVGLSTAEVLREVQKPFWVA